MTPSGTNTAPIRKQFKRIGRLKTAQDVAKYIARLIKRTERGEGAAEENRNYKLTMMASILLKAIEVSTLEKRIEKLEQKVNGESR